MAYASLSGSARTNPSNPQAHAICDRCGFRFNWVDLKWQYDWRGPTMQNIKFLVCRRCYDTPQEQQRTIVVPADPLPIINARPELYADAETNYHTATAPATIDPTTGLPIPPTTNIITENGDYRIEQDVGAPLGLDQDAIMPLSGTTAYGVVIPILSVYSVGTPYITVTCPSPHNLTTGAQISINGLNNSNACGFYNVTVTTATMFTYITNQNIPAGTLSTATTRAVTANVGLPYNDTLLPHTGV